MKGPFPAEVDLSGNAINSRELYGVNIKAGRGLGSPPRLLRRRQPEQRDDRACPGIFKQFLNRPLLPSDLVGAFHVAAAAQFVERPFLG